MDSDIDSEERSDFTLYLEHISQRKKFQQNTTLNEHSYSSTDCQQGNLCSSIKTLFIHRIVPNENITDNVDIETLDDDVKLPTYRPEVESKSIETYRNSKIPRDPETWEDNINKLRWNKLERTLFDRAMYILYTNQLSRLSYEGTVQEDIQKIIATEKSVAEMHHLLTNFALWDLSLSQWLHGLFITHLPDDYLASYIDILEKLKLISPSFVTEMISTNPVIRTKEEIKCINLEEPIDPFNHLLTTYPPLKLPKNPVIILVPDFPGYCTQANTRTHNWMNALSYLAEVDVALAAKVPWDYEEYSREEELDIETNLDAMVDATRRKIVSVRSEDPNRPIILAGNGVSAAIACQVAVLEKVDGLVCIGFIVNSTEVKRGYEGDCILGLECPTIFVTGQLSIFSPVLDLEELRVKLKCKTSHVLVGGANDDLVMNHSTKKKEAVTQKLVDRCVLEEIGNFLKEVLDPSPKVTCKFKPDFENSDFKKPGFAKKKPHNKLLTRLNKGNQKLTVSANNQSRKKPNAKNRKKINIPCTSLASTMTSVTVKDEELMPPPPSTQDYAIKYEDTSDDSTQFDEIPKLGDHKFATLTDLILKQEERHNINSLETTSSFNGACIIFTQDHNNIVVNDSNLPSQQKQQTSQTTTSVIGEITADEILDMPIVFADETSLDEIKPDSNNITYFISNENNDQLMTIKDEILEPNDTDVSMVRTAISEGLKIKQVAYDSPSKVKLVVNKAPKSLVPSGYQTFSVPSQKAGNIQFVNRLSMQPNKQSKIVETGARPRVLPKTVSIRQIQENNLKLLKTSTGQPTQLNKMKTMATTQKFKKII